MQVYPNPSQGEFNIKIPYLKNGSDIALKIVDPLGKTVIEDQIGYKYNKSISCLNLTQGIYYLVVMVHDHSFIQKICILKNK